MRSVFAGIGLLVVIFGALFLWNRSVVPVEAPMQQPLPGDGIKFGFVRSVATSSDYVLMFDEARWLTGPEGEQAAIIAGICSEAARAECLPNGYFIENTSTTTIPLNFSTEPIIAMFTLTMEKESVKETSISKDAYAALINDRSAHWSQLPYQMLIEQGKVTILEEVYVP